MINKESVFRLKKMLHVGSAQADSRPGSSHCPALVVPVGALGGGSVTNWSGVCMASASPMSGGAEVRVSATSGGSSQEELLDMMQWLGLKVERR